jgi:tRNA pseudouridine55 synthase
MDGILNINKPRGLTSFDVVARIKRITGERRVGHAGTLDPLATGVLPVCLGKASRIIEYLFDETKTYRTRIELGVTTDSYDSTGTVLTRADSSTITLAKLESVLASFRGTIMQTPPMYSAVKHKGTPLYKLARMGIEVERKSRTAQIFKLDVIDWQPPFFSFEVVCGKGTYIRSLAHDIGKDLGCGAVMIDLARLSVGPFQLEEAVTLEQIMDPADKGYAERHLYPPDYALQSFNAMVVNHAQECSLIHGMPVDLGPPIIETKNRIFCRVYNEDGGFVGMAEYDPDSQRWQPHKIFLEPCCCKSNTKLKNSEN